MRCLVALMGGYFIITTLLSLTVNPWRINKTPFEIDALDSSREISGTVRVGKAALANKGNWQTVILGSSRMEIGFNPEHPVFADTKTVNLAMSAANILETVPAGNYVLDRNPGIKTLILGIDAGDLHNDLDSRKYNTRFFNSPFADNNISIERSINQLIGGRSLVDSIATIQRHLSGKQPDRSHLGQWINPNYPGNLRAYVESTFKMGFEPSRDAWNLRSQTLRQGKADLLSGFIKRVREEGIRMYIIIPPQHALKQIHPELNAPTTVCWEKDLLELREICTKANSVNSQAPPVELWSFLHFNEYTTRKMPSGNAGIQRMEGWFDLGHAQDALGDLILNNLFSREAGADPNTPTVGINLTSTDWDSFRNEWIAAHSIYCGNNPEDVAWWRSHMNQAADSGISTRVMDEDAN